MARTWIRLYTDLRHNPKIQRLPDHLFKFVINCWCMIGASENDCLPAVDEIAFELRIDEKICQAYIDHLIEQKVLIRRKHTGMLTGYHWDDRQFLSDSSVDRVRKYRERQKKQEMKRYSNGEVTVQDSDSDSDSDQKKNRSSSVISEPLDEQFAEFRSLFEEVGNPIPEEFANGSFCHRAWGILDFFQRKVVVESLRERKAAGVQVLNRPDTYLTKGEYKRKIRQHRNGTGNTAEELAAL